MRREEKMFAYRAGQDEGKAVFFCRSIGRMYDGSDALSAMWACVGQEEGAYAFWEFQYFFQDKYILSVVIIARLRTQEEIRVRRRRKGVRA